MALIEYNEETLWVVNIITVDDQEYTVASGLIDEEVALEVSRAVRNAYINGLRDARSAIASKIDELDF